RREEARRAMKSIMEGKATPAQIAAFLVALRVKGETSEEVTSFAQEMMEKAVGFSWDGDILVDTCGTGGDGKGTFNVSTACVFVVGACGLKVAKHGNRALSSKCGSADVLEEMGVRVDLSPLEVKKCLEEVGIGFLYAPLFHPAMKYALSPRREIGIRTVFNLLGPLVNPLRANVRVMGVYDSSVLSLCAETLLHLGVRRAFVVQGEDGLDEVSVSAPTKVIEVERGKRILAYQIEPEELGVKRWPLAEVRGGDRRENARIIKSILEGKERGAKRDIVVVNSSFCLMAAGIVSDLKEGVRMAGEIIDSGKALEKLKELIEFTQNIPGEKRYAESFSGENS
ncbi:anthranilate phosphoribosyltransferase, partial [Candidatus Aerophobetes bacterium]|nr:anthranilate phosphoribosyltransferase [Candidatus Aerophobetes bacterium]